MVLLTTEGDIAHGDIQRKHSPQHGRVDRQQTPVFAKDAQEADCSTYNGYDRSYKRH